MSDDYRLSRDALEEAFFARRAELLAEARAQRMRVLAEHELVEATGIHDVVQLRDLMSAGLTLETAGALAIVPLVVVAWASGYVHPREREVALAAAVANGIPESSKAYAMYSSWLDERPAVDLLEAWSTYVHALRTRITPETYGELRHNLLARARKIAEAAGGPGDRGEIIPAEAAALERIAALM